MASVVGRTWVVPPRGDGKLYLADLVPVLTLPGTSNVTTTTATGFVTVSRSGGTLYAVVTASATAPTAAQIKAGQDHASAAAEKSANQVVASAGVKSFAFTALTGTAAKYVHFVHNASSVDSNISTSASFTLATVGAGIADVSGTMLDGSALTITGSSFGTKAVAAPVLFDNFENATVGSNLPGRVPPIGTAAAYQQFDPIGGAASIPKISSARPYGGTKHARMDYPTNSTGIFPKLANNVGHMNEVYIAFWAYHSRYAGTGSVGSFIFKWNRAGGGPDPYSANPRFYETIRAGTYPDMTWVDRGYVTATGTTWDQNLPNYSGANEQDGDRWNFIEYFYKLSTPGVANGEWRKWVNGIACTTSGANQMTRAAADSQDIQFVISCFDGLDSYAAGSGFYLDLDCYWIDSTRQRVVVGNASTWAACTRKDPQPASAWADGSITVTANLPNYASGTTVYFYVIDASGNPINANGFAKVVGGIFQDGFETGNFSHTQGSARWASPNGTVAVSSTRAKTGTYSAKFTFGPNPDGQDSWAELPFELGGNYPEVWCAYDLWVPSNYYHRSQGDGSNNKGFLYLWSGDYGSPSGPAMGPNFWPAGGGLPMQAGESRMKGYLWVPYDQHIEPSVEAIYFSDRGKWVHIVCHYKYASAANNDGCQEIWKTTDGVQRKLLDIRNGPWYMSSAPGFQRGYILGWSNSGFTDLTEMYVDNVIFSTSSLLGS
jgi:hypothetical protein